MTKNYFENLIPELSSRAARATLGRLGFSNPALRAHLQQVFSRQIGTPGSYLGEPVFEATFGWQPAEVSLQQLAGGLLSERLVNALDQPPGGNDSGYRFPRNAFPYQHQLEAWRHLSVEQARSVVVTSGTGSGKTECFMVPILDRLAREQQSAQRKLVGVRALFLYPLNALIQSQQERLHAWTAGFGGDIRFCLYNGNTPEKEAQHRRDQIPNQVIDREALRASPPPILVTNSTMLEYMLVRAQDAPILDASQGKLQWIVLDEAHTYIGSQAAELALLLRRVLHAFGVKAADVRFVATSATIGGDDAAQDLQRFLAHLAGLPPEHVYVVSGKRKIPGLETGNPDFKSATLDQLCAISTAQPAERYNALCANSTSKSLRQLFVPEETRARHLCDISAEAGKDSKSSADQTTALRWLDLLTSARAADGTPFLPLRVHLFHNVLPGLWACADPCCSCRKGTDLDAEEWPFGMVFMEERRHCDCGAPVFELRSCNDCNTTYLWAARTIERKTGVYRLTHSTDYSDDDFQLDVEQPEDESEASQTELIDSPLLIANAHQNSHTRLVINRKTLEIDPEDPADTLVVHAFDADSAEDRVLICPECGGHDGDGNRFFRRAILGAPFLLGEIIPTLLEFCPDFDAKGVSPLTLPWRGRRMITFTDSRQGTARIAVKLQQESERNAVRSLIYRRMLQAGNQASGERARKLKSDIEALSAVSHAPGIPDIITKMQDELKTLDTPQAVPWREIVSWLATNEDDVRKWAYDYYSDLDPQIFNETTGKEVLASILTMREFARRPKRLNSPETMGLVAVRYPKLDAVMSLPDNPCGLSLQDWKDFLKISLDFWVRENTFIDLPDSWRKWGGNRLASKRLLPPLSTEQQSSRIKRWPQCNPVGVHPRLVRLLAYALNIDPAHEHGRDQLDGLLRRAWETLVSLDLLTSSSDGRFLRFGDMAFSPISRGWLCPVTRRVLDTTLRGVTPYLPRKDLSERHAKCKPIDIPLCRVALEDFASEDGRLAAIRAWLNEEPAIQNLRKEGVWSDLNDRVVEGSRYFRTAEHSAQQSGSRLKEYESSFKTGRINLLSCSTTMEMGVDIGGISVVAMNNVPPHPANYLQRAGRAGRRSETRSVALTVCKNNPHDQSVLRNTLWPFRTRISAPKVLLSSAIIVQRHVNSLLLSHFLKQEIAGHGSVEKLDMAWWFLPQGKAPSDRFHAWAGCFTESRESSLSAGLRSLIRHTCHEGISSLVTLVSRAAGMIQKHQKAWFSEYDVIQDQLAKFSGNKEKNPAFKALTMQSSRLTGEYLLRELATAGVLPGYSFPTDIASLDTLTCDGIEREKSRQKKASRDDNGYQRRELPSRDIAVALREYAPGAELVIDGMVYQSRGVTLNWHAPASEKSISEIQNLRRAWRCNHCGSSGTSLGADNVSACPDCGAMLSASKETLFDYLDPAGFAVDLYVAPHNDVSQQSYVPVQRPWIDARGPWRPLSNPARGQMRTSDCGTVFHYSSGTSGNGYAICLHCGRAEPMPSDSEMLPELFQDHKTGQYREHRRLRGAEGGETAVCTGSHSSFAIKRDLRLGHESSTDVLELLFYGLDGKPLNDVPTAFSIAVAVRSSIATLLGIEITELGCDTKPVQLPGSRVGQAIVIYDHNASGYCSSVTEKIDEVLNHAYEFLLCAADCPDACQCCLLQFDTRYRLPDLNRHAALEFMGGAWIEHLGLPANEAFFGNESYAEWQSLAEAITRSLAMPGAGTLRLYLQGSAQDWDLPVSPLRAHIRRWSSTPIELVTRKDILKTLEPEDLFALNGLLALENVSLHTSSDALEFSNGTLVLAEMAIGKDNEWLIWGNKSPTDGVPDMFWGEQSNALLVAAKIDARACLITPAYLAPPKDVKPGTFKLDITNELDGKLQGFGTRLLELIERTSGKALIEDNEEIQRLTYHDRYLKNPMSTALLLETISALKQRHLRGRNPEEIEIITTDVDESRGLLSKSNRIWDDWSSTQARNGAIHAAFEYCGMNATVRSLDKRQSRHARVLDIVLTNSKRIQITLDQGFSCWRVVRQGANDNHHWQTFSFSTAAEQQGERIANLTANLQGPVHATYIVIQGC